MASPPLTTLPVLLAVTLLLVAACGGSDDDGNGGEVGGVEGREAGGAGDAPPGDDLDAVEPLVENLLSEYDDVVNEILADPSLVTDQDSELAQRYLAIYEPDSDAAESGLDAWAADSEAGVSVEPYDDEHPALTTRIDGPLETVSDDEVTVAACEVRRERVYENGQLTEGVPLLEDGIEVTVVRVDGEWLLRHRILRTDTVGCATSTEAE